MSSQELWGAKKRRLVQAPGKKAAPWRLFSPWRLKVSTALVLTHWSSWAKIFLLHVVFHAGKLSLTLRCVFPSETLFCANVENSLRLSHRPAVRCPEGFLLLQSWWKQTRMVSPRNGWWCQNGLIFGVPRRGGGGGVMFIVQSKNLYCRFFTFIHGLKEGFSEKICTIIFREWGGGSKAIWNFSEDSIVLIPLPDPKVAT